MGRAWVLWLGLLGCTQDFGAFAQGSSAEVIPVAADGAAPDGAAPAISDASVAPSPTNDASAPSQDASPSDASEAGSGDGGVACTDTGGRVFNNHCYFVLPTKQTYDNARAACLSRGAHLVTLGSSAEQGQMSSLQAADDRWIGLRRAAGSPSGDGSFGWITGESRTYTNWGPGEPNGSGECVRLLPTTGTWADYACSTVLFGVCERE